MTTTSSKKPGINELDFFVVVVVVAVFIVGQITLIKMKYNGIKGF